MSVRWLWGAFILTAFFLFSITLFPSLSGASFIQEKSQIIETINKKDHVVRSRANVSIQKHPLKEGLYLLNMQGEGEYAGFENVQWHSQAEIEQKEGRAWILKTFTKIFSKGKVLFSSLKSFDYASNMATIEIHKGNKTMPSVYSFPIKGLICDDVTMVHFLSKMTSLQERDPSLRFNLLTNEPKLYSVMIRPRGKEHIKLPTGGYNTEKFQLMADLGPLTGIASQIVPPTYIWFPENDPLNWIQYEGMETGYETAHIISYVLNNQEKGN